MSHLSSLIRAAKELDPRLGKDLEAQIRPLQERLPFGLNFERHVPEAVELPGHKIRRGDKVRVMPPRGSVKVGDTRLWRVESIEGNTARVFAGGVDTESKEVDLNDLLLVAEFTDRVYPGLRYEERVERGEDKPFHTVINGENYHVLKQLRFTHYNAIDAIYIDPPYNSGARDWKYNNDYVDNDDLYRHSKWLAFLERRLRLAKDLLNKENSVLIITIDEKEYLRLGLLLEQVFDNATIQMVTSVIAPHGSQRPGLFSRMEEYIYFVFIGDASVHHGNDSMIDTSGSARQTDTEWKPSWDSLIRRGTGATRADRPGMFYPVFVQDERLLEIGEPLPATEHRDLVAIPDGAEVIWPVRTDGTEGRWQVGRERLRELFEDGYARIGKKRAGRRSIAYLKAGEISKLQGDLSQQSVTAARSVWNKASHSAGSYGTTLLRTILPGRRFPFPKSLYAVEDSLRFIVQDKPDAVVLDFFAGSGTTAHAVMRLNKQDGGRRQCISVTNNEVSAEEQKNLRKQELRPGDAEWEKNGICEYITKPRIRSAITGITPEGLKIKGKYRFTDEFSMADGFEENAAFLSLTYESPWMVSTGRAFETIAPMLWLRAGAKGRSIDRLESGWAVADTYGIIRDLDQASDFIAALLNIEEARIAYIVTDDEGRYQQVANEIPGVLPVRLYEDYLRNFESGGFE